MFRTGKHAADKGLGDILFVSIMVLLAIGAVVFVVVNSVIPYFSIERPINPSISIASIHPGTGHPKGAQSHSKASKHRTHTSATPKRSSSVSGPSGHHQKPVAKGSGVPHPSVHPSQSPHSPQPSQPHRSTSQPSPVRSSTRPRTSSPAPSSSAPRLLPTWLPLPSFIPSLLAPVTTLLPLP